MWCQEIVHLDSYSRVGCIPQSENTIKTYQFNMNYKNLDKEKRPQGNMWEHAQQVTNSKDRKKIKVRF